MSVKLKLYSLELTVSEKEKNHASSTTSTTSINSKIEETTTSKLLKERTNNSKTKHLSLIHTEISMFGSWLFAYAFVCAHSLSS